MSDLVERLRAVAAEFDAMGESEAKAYEVLQPSDAPTLREAAAEIERLRSEREDERAAHAITRAHRNVLAAERDALRAEVRKLTAADVDMALETQDLHDERDALRAALRPLLDATEQSVWHCRDGEQVKRICVAESALARMRAALSAAPEPGR